MKRMTLTAAILFAAVASWLFAQDPYETLYDTAIKEHPTLTPAAITAIRAGGPSSLGEFLAHHSEGIARLRKEIVTLGREKLPPESARLLHAIESISRQRDSWTTGLYWYTDLKEAQHAAARSGRPIVSLHLLGSLDDEFS